MRLFGLPDADKVFMTYFDRWYQPSDRARKRFPATRPDVVCIDVAEGTPASALCHLNGEGLELATKMVASMVDASVGDWPAFLDVAEPVNETWVDAFDRYYDVRRIKALMKASKPDDFSNDFLVRCCEFGAVLGHVLRQRHPDLEWLYGWPYWESALYDRSTGLVIAVFHWAIKRFSSYGVDDIYVQKLEMCTEMIQRQRAAR